MATTNATDLLVAGNTVKSHTSAAGTGFTARVTTSPDGDIAEDRVVTAVGSYSATAPLSPTGQWVMQMVAFRAADIAPPTAPTNLVAVVTSASQINLSWTAATDDVGVTSYSVERCQGAGCSTFAEVGTPTATTFASTGLTGATSYSFRVRARDAAANFGAYSATASATTQAATCTTNSQCATGFCSGGVCCNSACNGGCGACNLPGKVGTCSAVASGTTCRASAGGCDVAETCNGTSVICPADAFLPATTTCRVAAGSCDIAENCPGTSATCPTDTNLPENSGCTDGNECTILDRCHAGVCVPGMNVTCPGDACQPAGTCNPTTGLCSIPAPILDDTSCDDGNRCTVGDTYNAGICIPGADTGCLGAGDTYYVPLIGLGTTQGSSYARGINEAGEVVGADSRRDVVVIYPGGIPSKGFRWTASEGIHFLPSPVGTDVFPVGINKDGVIAGTTVDQSTAWFRVFRVDPSTDTQLQFPPVPTGAALAINDAGTIAGHGYFVTPQGNVHTMFRAQGNTVQIIPGPSGDQFQAAFGIDEIGSLFGYTYRQDNSGAAIRYTDALGLEYLNHLVPAGSDWNLDPDVGGDYLANAFAGNGTQIVGYGYTGNGLLRGFSLTPADPGTPGRGAIQTIPMISRFPPETTNYYVNPYGINAGGEVVGGILPAGSGYPVYAFYWASGTGTVDLNDLIDPTSGWHLNGAFGINGRREVVGYGVHNDRMEAFKMTVPDLSPCPGADLCHTVGLRNLRTAACPAPVAITSIPACQEGIALRSDGVVDLGGGKLVAVFGFKNTSTVAVHPTSNTELINGVAITNPQTPPPVQLPVGDYAGAFLPVFNVGQTVTWQVDGQSVSASVSSQHLSPVGTGPGIQVRIGATPTNPGTLVTVKGDLTQFKAVELTRFGGHPRSVKRA